MVFIKKKKSKMIFTNLQHQTKKEKESFENEEKNVSAGEDIISK